MRNGTIYKITCLCTDKVYIGQTLLHPAMRRWIQHYREINNYDNDLYLYRAMRRWGIKNFIFQILEEEIPINELDSKEIEYIKIYKSYDPQYGYNLTRGGKLSSVSKITFEIVEDIIKCIKSNPDYTFVEIAEKFKVSRDIISDINCGETWYNKNEKYPIRDNSTWNKVLSDKVDEIYQLLRQQVSLTEIAKLYSVSVTNISNINQGKIYKRDDILYPIYKPTNSKKHLDEEKVREIVDMILTTNKNYSEIGFELGIGRKSIAGINNGKLYLDILNKIGYNDFPIRK